MLVDMYNNNITTCNLIYYIYYSLLLIFTGTTATNVLNEMNSLYLRN